MGTKLFGVDIAGTLNRALGPGLMPMTLTRYTTGAVDPDNLAAGPAREAVAYACRGFIDDRTLRGSGVGFQPADNIVRKERQVSILGDSIAGGTVIPLGDPEGHTGDKVTVDGKTYSIINVKSDPARAMYICMVRA